MPVLHAYPSPVADESGGVRVKPQSHWNAGHVVNVDLLSEVSNIPTANKIYAGPSSGSAASPTFRSLVAADIPSLSSVYVPYSGATGNVNLNTKELTGVKLLNIAQSAFGLQFDFDYFGAGHPRIYTTGDNFDIHIGNAVGTVVNIDDYLVVASPYRLSIGSYGSNNYWDAGTLGVQGDFLHQGFQTNHAIDYFNISGNISYPDGLFYISDSGGYVYIGDFAGDLNGTSIVISDVAATITHIADTHTFNGRILASDGNVTYPGIGFASNVFTGMYLASPDHLALTSGGIKTLVVDASNSVTGYALDAHVMIVTADSTSGANQKQSFNCRNLGRNTFAINPRPNFGLLEIFLGNATDQTRVILYGDANGSIPRLDIVADTMFFGAGAGSTTSLNGSFLLNRLDDASSFATPKDSGTINCQSSVWTGTVGDIYRYAGRRTLAQNILGVQTGMCWGVNKNANSGQFDSMFLGDNQSLGLGTTNPSAVNHVKGRRILNAPQASSSGLVTQGNWSSSYFFPVSIVDFTTYTGNTTKTYRIRVASSTTFDWSDTDGSVYNATGITITGAAQTLNNGIQIKFNQTTGLGTGDVVRFKAWCEDLLKYEDADGNIRLNLTNQGLLGVGVTPSGNGQLQVKAGSGSGIAKVGGVIFDHYVDAGNTTTTETDLYSDTIPASTVGTNGDKLSAEYGGVYVSSATATRQIKIYFGGTVVFDTGALTLSLSSAWTAYVSIIRVSSTVIRYMISFATEGAALAAYTATGELTGLTLSNTNILKITGQAAGVGAATNDIVAKLGSIEFKSAA